MLPQQVPISTASTHSYGLIDRVLHLRQQLGIETALSVRDAEDILLSPEVLQASSLEMPRLDCRDWLAWSQSPDEGNQPEKGQEDLLRCQ